MFYSDRRSSTWICLALSIALVQPAAAGAGGGRFFVDDADPATCQRRLAYADGAYDRDDAAAIENLAAMKEARADLERMVFLWWPGGPGPFLEVGPLADPVLRPDLPRTTVYWDMDLRGLAEIERWGSRNEPGRVHPLYVDLNHLTPAYRAAFEARNHAILSAADAERPGFRAVVIAQVLNYVDHRALLKMVAALQSPRGYLFITNRVDHGDTAHFHAARPRRAEDVDRALEALGYRVVRRLPSRNSAAGDGQVTWMARLK